MIAQYIVECHQVLLQQERIAQRMMLNVENVDDISDKAIDIYTSFLRETTPPCRLLQSLYLWNLPPRQASCLLKVWHTNRSVKTPYMNNFQENDAALWIAALLRHKADFTDIGFSGCVFFVYANSSVDAWTTQIAETTTLLVS
jgi:hypothetical protein